MIDDLDKWGEGVDPNPFNPLPFKSMGHIYGVQYKSGGGSKVKETETQRTQSAIALEKWERAVENLHPVQDKYIENVDKLKTKGASNYVSGAAHSQSNLQGSKAIDQGELSLARAGINPGSGQFVSGISDMAEQVGKASAENSVRSGNSLTDSYVAGKKNIIAMGNNEQTQTHRGLSSLSSYSGRQAVNDARLDQRNRFHNQSLIGSAAGLATYGFEKFNEKEGV